MKYEFHVGDYVEREVADGINLKTLIGYVNFYQTILDSCGVIHCFGFTWGNGTKGSIACTEYQFPMYFKRIGKYDFAKMRYQYDSVRPEQPKKIEKLTPNGWCMGTSGDDLIRKINELADAVNELRNK